MAFYTEICGLLKKQVCRRTYTVRMNVSSGAGVYPYHGKQKGTTRARRNRNDAYWDAKRLRVIHERVSAQICRILYEEFNGSVDRSSVEEFCAELVTEYDVISRAEIEKMDLRIKLVIKLVKDMAKPSGRIEIKPLYKGDVIIKLEKKEMGRQERRANVAKRKKSRNLDVGAFEYRTPEHISHKL